MYDYMKALQKRFDRQSHPELDTQIGTCPGRTAAGHGRRREEEAAAAAGRTKHIAG